MFDTPHEILISRVVLLDARSPQGATVIDEYVDSVATEEGLIRLLVTDKRFRRCLVLRVGCVGQALRVVDNVFFHRNQVFLDLLQPDKALSQVIEERPDAESTDLQIELPQLVAGFALPTRELL